MEVVATATAVGPVQTTSPDDAPAAPGTPRRLVKPIEAPGTPRRTATSEEAHGTPHQPLMSDDAPGTPRRTARDDNPGTPRRTATADVAPGTPRRTAAPSAVPEEAPGTPRRIATEDGAVGETGDDNSDVGQSAPGTPYDDDAAAWYAAAAEGGSDDEAEDTTESAGVGVAVRDPYLSLSAVSDPYEVVDVDNEEASIPATSTLRTDSPLEPASAQQPDSSESTENSSPPVVAGQGHPEPETAVVSDVNRLGVDTPLVHTAAAVLAAAVSAAQESQPQGQQLSLQPVPPAPQVVHATPSKPSVVAAENIIDLTDDVPEPLPEAPAPPMAPPVAPTGNVLDLVDVDMVPVPPDGDAAVEEEGEDAPNTIDIDMSGNAHLSMPEGEEWPWDERVLVVRHGQVHIELQHLNPPMQDDVLKKFCDWLQEQMPVVISNFPYVRKAGAYVDLSDNNIGPEGLDKLFRVLRDFRVPCVVMKAYRNVLDDSIVDTIIEYLYTQPEAFPMHGIHISHNNITDKGALRLIRAAALCGHYPRLTTRLPLWLRLEANEITDASKVITDCQDEGYNVCLMSDGLCSRPDCNHYSGVHVQLPYFFHQGRNNPQVLTLATQSKTSMPTPPDWQRAARTGAPDTLKPKMMAAPKKRAAPFNEDGIADEVFKPMPCSLQRVVRPKMASQMPMVAPLEVHYHGRNGAHKPDETIKPCSEGSYLAPGWDERNYSGKSSGKGYRRGRLWIGPTLMTKSKSDVRLVESDLDPGFKWKAVEPGKCPFVTEVDPQSKVGQVTQAGDMFLRLNGLDVSMFTEKQIRDMLEHRPLTLRFGEV